jgi:energy-coupling factor transporter ATP-binding protein EcfA2
VKNAKANNLNGIERRHSARHVHLRDRRQRQRQVDAGQRGRRQGAQPAPAPPAAGGTYGSVKGAEALDKMVVIDQSPIGRTPRSNPATYTGAFDLIRELFSLTPEAKMRGYTPGRFSFNVKGGRCEACQGDGIIKIEMHFLPDVYVPCEVCKGKRYNAQTLEVKYKGKSIADVLEMRVDEAAELFAAIPRIANKLKTIAEVGLGYIKMGQPATQLSGGEAQRIKLATELSKRATGRTFYVLDEPTTGLHFADIHKLLDVLQRLVGIGNTVLVIEHNLDVIKTADYVIDLGPEGGDKGGTIVGTGTPEEIAANPASFTGEHLRGVLSDERAAGRVRVTSKRSTTSPPTAASRSKRKKLQRGSSSSSASNISVRSTVKPGSAGCSSVPDADSLCAPVASCAVTLRASGSITNTACVPARNSVATLSARSSGRSLGERISTATSGAASGASHSADVFPHMLS